MPCLNGFGCDGGLKCLPMVKFCDSVDDCIDGTDEMHCRRFLILVLSDL